MILNDSQIEQLGIQGRIVPFERELVRQVKDSPVISFGLSSFGYDIRLSGKEFKIFKHIPGSIIDPKNFNPKNLEPAFLHSGINGDYFILPAHSYGLGVAVEYLNVPTNTTVICLGKSTYARCGIIANVTPAEAGWKGHLTLELSNSSNADCKIYVNEGIVQLIFLQGSSCNVSYQDRSGKYQNQKEEITISKV